MNRLLSCVAVGALSLLVGCGEPPMADTPIDDPPTGGTGNIWIISDTSGCGEFEELRSQAKQICAPYKQVPANVIFGLPCLKWYMGIGGPYALPGALTMQFQCSYGG